MPITKISDGHYGEYGDTYANPYPNNFNGGGDMELEKYIERLDQDRRESEQRMQQNISRMESQLREDRQLMEQRITEERRLSEERMSKQFSEAMSEMREARKEIRDSKNWITGLCITAILGIATIAVAVLLAI